MIKNALIIFLFILSNIYFSFTNEKVKSHMNKDVHNFQEEVNDVNFIIKNSSCTSDIFFTFNNEDVENYATKKKTKKSNNSLYAFHKKIGTGLLIPGVILTVTGFIMMGAGVPLSIISEERSSTSINSSYIYQQNYTGASRYTTSYETVYPYQAVGIPLAATGGLFFVVGIGLMVPGIVNLVKVAKYKNKSSLSSGFALNLNYNPFDESINLNAKFKF